MNEQNYIPVTQQQATESKISNSVKISKQLMKSELKKRITVLLAEYEELIATSEKLKESFKNQLNSEIKRQVHMYMNNDSELTRFRNLFAKFSRYNGNDEKNYPKFKNNLDMLDSFCTGYIYKSLFKISSVNSSCPVYSEFLKGRCLVNVNLKMIDNHNDDIDSNYISNMEKLGYGQPVQISQDTVDMYLLCVTTAKKASVVNVKHKQVTLQLADIDAVAEEMEAQLLVSELRKTEEGHEALKIAGDLVAGMLGDIPTLLQVK
jgi:hypothetical protein